MQLAHQQVDIVAGVADQGDPLGVAGQVGRPAAVVTADQELGRVVAVVQVRHAGGAVAVDDLEVGPGAAGVADLGQLGMVGQRGPVGGQVMSYELPEHRPASGPLRILPPAGLRPHSGGIAGPAGPAQGVQGVVSQCSGSSSGNSRR